MVKQFYLTNSWDPNWVRVKVRVMAMKRYFIFPKAWELDSLVSSPGHSQHILHPHQPTKLWYISSMSTYNKQTYNSSEPSCVSKSKNRKRPMCVIVSRKNFSYFTATKLVSINRTKSTVQVRSSPAVLWS